MKHLLLIGLLGLVFCSSAQTQSNKKWAAPNVFTPDGDELNDDFFVFTFNGTVLTSFTIYNRWGAVLHNETTPWKGLHKGEELPKGVYFWTAGLKHPDGTEERINGDINLIR